MPLTASEQASMLRSRWIVKLHILILLTTLSSVANDHSICVSVTDAKRLQCIKMPRFPKAIIVTSTTMLLLLPLLPTVPMRFLFLGFIHFVTSQIKK